MLNAPKWAARTKNQPTTPTKRSGRNLSTTLTFWNHVIWRMPARLMAAGTQRPTRAMHQFCKPSACQLNRASTSKTQLDTMAAFPAHDWTQ